MNSTTYWLSTAFHGAVAFIPSLFAGLVILAIGYIVARVLASATRAVLGRVVLLVVDWILGANGGAGALLCPRGHVRNLLGGAAPMDLSQRASAAALVFLAIASALIAIRRARI